MLAFMIMVNITQYLNLELKYKAIIPLILLLICSLIANLISFKKTKSLNNKYLNLSLITFLGLVITYYNPIEVFFDFKSIIAVIVGLNIGLLLFNEK